MWHIAFIRHTVEELSLSVIRMRLGSLGLKYDAQNKTLSGSYRQVAVTYSMPTRTRGCACKIGIKEDVIDVHGRAQ